jgi:hypothetical protein
VHLLEAEDPLRLEPERRMPNPPASRIAFQTCSPYGLGKWSS